MQFSTKIKIGNKKNGIMLCNTINRGILMQVTETKQKRIEFVEIERYNEQNLDSGIRKMKRKLRNI